MDKLIKSGFKLGIYAYLLLLLISLGVNNPNNTFISGESSILPWIPDFITQFIGVTVIITFWYVAFFISIGLLKNIGRVMDDIAENNFNDNKKDNLKKIKSDEEATMHSNKTLTKNKKLKSKSEYAKAIGLVSLGFILATIIILPKTENATYKAKCELYTPMSNYERYRSKTSWDRVIEIEYTTGIFWNQKFVLNKYIELDDVSTFKGHAEGTKYPARPSGYNANFGRKLKFVYDEVPKSLYVEEFDKYDNLSKLVRYQCK